MMPSLPSYAPVRTLLALALLSPLGCGGPGDAGSTNGSTTDSTTGDVEPDQWDDLLAPVAGSRLLPRFRVAEDGTRAQIGWHDTLFDAPCEFRHTSTAGLRCVPVTSGNDPWHYADSSCTQPVIQDIWIPEGATVVYARGNGCFDQRYFEVGEPVAEIYYAANGPCEFFSNDPSHRVYAIAQDQFVAATLTPQDGNSRIVPLLLEAEDGSRQIFGAWDRERDEEVLPQPDAADQLRWFGRREPRVSTYYFADATCTERVAVAECIPGTEHPRTAKETTPGPCQELLGHHELLEEMGSSSVYVLRNGGCDPGSLSAGYASRVWRVGAPLDDASYASASALDEGGTRLRHDVYASPEGEPFLSSRRWFDRLLAEAECLWRDPSIYTAEPPTGTLDCYPRHGAQMGNRYLDSSCTQRTASRWVDEESCPPAAQHAYGGGRVAALAGPAAGAGGHMLDADDDCVPVPADDDSGDGGGFGEYEHYLVDDATEVEAAHAVDVVE
jgi:hypothetical protein